MKTKAKKSDKKKAQPIKKAPKINDAALAEALEMSRGLPDEIIKAADTFKWVFLHAYPDMDAALKGMNVIDRPKVYYVSESVLVVDAKVLKPDQNVFIGGVRVKGLGMGVVEKIVDGLAYIAGMGSEIQE